jgi:hypothetical protein
MNNEKIIGQEGKVSGHGLIEGTSPEFTRRD